MALRPISPTYDQIDRHDEAQQPQHDQDQDAGEEGDERRDVGNGEGHCDSPKISIRSRLSLSETHTLKYWWWSSQNWHRQGATPAAVFTGSP
jgi:hypothetical protein